MISVVILSHNSDTTIKKTLESVAWADEVIVVDDDSTDTTRAIARKFTKHIYTRALKNDFSAQRNFGIEHAHGDWIFFVDSDEVVSAELATEIKEHISRANNETCGYYIHRQDVLWGRALRFGETAHVRLLRIARKGKGSWIRPVHEVWDVHGDVQNLSHPLLHYPHPNVAQFLDSINTYSTLEATFLHSQHAYSPWWRIVLNPFGKFCVNYFLRFGFLDGTQGAIVAIMMSFHSFLTRGKLYLLQHGRNA